MDGTESTPPSSFPTPLKEESMNADDQGLNTPPLVTPDTPTHEETKRDSPKTIEEKADSPQIVGENSNSPKIIEENSNSPKIDEEKTDSPKNVEEKVDSPNSVQEKVDSPKSVQEKGDSPKNEEGESDSPEMQEKTDSPKNGENKPDEPDTNTPPPTTDGNTDITSSPAVDQQDPVEKAKSPTDNGTDTTATSEPERAKSTTPKPDEAPMEVDLTDDIAEVEPPKKDKSKEGSPSGEKSKADSDPDVCIIGDDKQDTASTPVPKPSVSKQPQACIVCNKVSKCKYNIVRNGDIKHLCGDSCFKAFRATPTQFLRNEEKEKSKAVEKPPAAKPSSDSANKTQLCTFCSKSFKTDQFSKFELKGGEIKPFCTDKCLREHKKGRKVCGFCHADVAGNKLSFLASVLDGNYFREFCNKDCHESFVNKEQPPKTPIVVNTPPVQTKAPVAVKAPVVTKAPVATTAQVLTGKDSPAIIKVVSPPGGTSSALTVKTINTKIITAKTISPRVEPVKANPLGKPVCSVCGQIADAKHEITFEGKLHKLCSDACFGAFRYANKLAVDECSFCGAYCINQDKQRHSIQFEGQAKKFCSLTCVNAFKVGKTKIIPCAWCSTKKLNFDMIERVDANNKYQLFCSLNCLSLYRVNLQATSNQRVPCDQCRKIAPAQYHLTMSDASVRNFCEYTCVMAFQAQFTQPANNNNASQQSPQLPNNRPTPMPMQQSKTSVPPPTRQSSRQANKVTMLQQSPTSSNVPVISNVMSLASSGTAPAGRGKSINNVANVGVGPPVANAGSQIIIQPPPPKAMRNKALLCKPFTQTKATSCRPHTTTRETQTDESMCETKKPILVPVPVPIYVPMPMAMYNAPQPYPLPIPVPIPVPFFIPTTKKSADSILRHIKEIQERMPADPFEAELLMMAEAVANADKSDSSDESDNEDRSAPEPTFESSLPLDPDPAGGAVGTGNDMGEDMLSMALRMAEMRSNEDNTLDLEDSIATTPIPPQPPQVVSPEPEFSTIDQDSDILSATRGNRGSGGWRGVKRRRGRGGSSNTSTTKAKRPRVEEPAPEPEPAVTPAPMPQPILSDANMVLKYSFGVNAWKHWVLQKNAQLEKASSTRSGRLKLFKTDLLQCTSDELNYSLCLFVKEVRKPNGDEYAPDSIYYLCLGIQQYLFENSRIDNIFTDFYYEKFTECLNEILQRYEVRLNTQGLIVCRIEEEHLWESKQLGAHSPHVLLNTLIYFNTRYFMLRTAEDHVRLSFSHIMKHWKKTNIPGTRTPGRSVYLRYYAPVNAKETSAKPRKREEVPVYEQGESVDNPLRCPVKLYEFYLSKCPESIRNRNDVFYLVPERSCVPDSPVWYSTASLGVEAMSKMLNRVRVVREIQERHLHPQPSYS